MSTLLARPPSSSDANNRTDAVLAQIRACFTQRDSDQARSEVGNIIDDLGLRYICEQAAIAPYLGIAEILRQVLRERGNSTDETSNWERAVELAAMYTANHTGLPADQTWISNVRVNCLSKAICGLRELGYDIGLPTSGGVDVTESETKMLICSQN